MTITVEAAAIEASIIATVVTKVREDGDDLEDLCLDAASYHCNLRARQHAEDNPGQPHISERHLAQLARYLAKAAMALVVLRNDWEALTARGPREREQEEADHTPPDFVRVSWGTNGGSEISNPMPLPWADKLVRELHEMDYRDAAVCL